MNPAVERETTSGKLWHGAPDARDFVHKMTRKEDDLILLGNDSTKSRESNLVAVLET